MYAVIETGGKQHRVTEGEVLSVEKLDLATGDSVDFEALMVADGDKVNVGSPIVEGSKVSAEVVAHGRGEKINIVKFKRRKHYRRQMGHRQWYTQIKITSIKA
jgi:large subunit ribosomal protein L21